MVAVVDGVICSFDQVLCDPCPIGMPVITEFEIKNYKSIDKLRLELGRVNVFIGENGAGKSNILEAVALAAAASANKLGNEFLASRGIRTTKPEWMRAGFDVANSAAPILLSARHDELLTEWALENDNRPYAKWLANVWFSSIKPAPAPEIDDLALFIRHEQALKNFADFVIYSPENTSLRTFQREGQIEPLGINGEGLLKLLGVLADENFGVLNKIKDRMRLLGWFQDFQVRAGDANGWLDIIDLHLTGGKQFFDHRSANEGFFFLLFYFALFSTDLTPKFFAIDNIDASLNPKLCEKLTIELVQLAKENDKQVILTAHNPAVLDGLNLDDDEQRLFVISRDVDGLTQVRRIHKPRETGQVVRLSELFIRGALGGLPKGF
jgi:predicted ATPase